MCFWWVMVQKNKEETLHKFSTSLQHQKPMDMAWLLQAQGLTIEFSKNLNTPHQPFVK
jgi:predicted naringenin-chalcone synthase